MKLPTYQKDMEGNLQPKTTQSFGIRQEDMGKIIGILRKHMYEHPIRTMVQEYVCNGRDANREVGKPDHELTITAPTRFEPTFKVRDYGPGVSPERVSNVFVNYGASTKIATNEQTGGFGLGAKSAWAYSDQFTVNTFIDGVKRTYSAHLGRDQNGSFDLIEEGQTEEVNGTEIIIPVKFADISEFSEAVKRAVFWWRKRPKLINMDELSKVGKVFKFDDSSYQVQSLKKSYNNDVIILIDGIKYPCPFNVDLTKTKHKTVLEFGNGELTIASSREKLVDDESNRELIEKKVKLIELKIKKIFEKVDKECKSSEDVIKAVEKYGDWFYHEFKYIKDGVNVIHTNSGLKIYKNVIKNGINFKEKLCEEYGLKTIGRWKNQRYQLTKFSCMSYQKEQIVFYNDKDESQNMVSKKIKQYLTNIMTNTGYVYYLLDNTAVDVFKDIFTVKKVSELTYAPPARVKGRGKLNKNDIEIIIHEATKYNTTLSARNLKLDSLKADTKYVYFVHKDRPNMQILKSFIEFIQDRKVIFFGASKDTIKIIKDYDEFISYDKYLFEFKLNDLEKTFVYYDNLSVYYKYIDLFHKEKVNDKETSKKYEELISLYKLKDKYEYNNISFISFQLFPFYKEIESIIKLRNSFKVDFNHLYPLLEETYSPSENKIVDYMNMCYKYSKEGN